MADLLIITGMSGAGKSRAMIAMEDMGYFCVDNLPPAILSKFIEGMRLSNDTLPQMAIAADIRSGLESLPQLEDVLTELRTIGVDLCVVFMEASNDVLVRRYKENRRPHPLARNDHKNSLLSCIQEERCALEGLRGQADYIIDTSDINERALVSTLLQIFGKNDISNSITVSVNSFGFKYGLPIDADWVLDVRFLPNPFYVNQLKEKTGLENDVAEYVLNNEICRDFMQKFMDLLFFLLPNYHKEGKKHFVLAVGCTGGRHRSVALAEFIGQHCREKGYTTAILHRDIAKTSVK